MDMDRLTANIRSVLRAEASGSVTFVVISLLALIVWVFVFTVNGWTNQASVNLRSQEGRLKTLFLLADEYKSLTSSGQSNISGNVDVATVFAQVSENMELGSRVNRITPDGRNQSVEINRLYADELAQLQKELATRGVRFTAAEIRALPAGRERLFTVSAIIGPVN